MDILGVRNDCQLHKAYLNVYTDYLLNKLLTYILIHSLNGAEPFLGI